MWIWQAITGALLLILLGVHMVAQHFMVPTGLRFYPDVVAYLSNPWIFALETVFLGVVITHALMGVRSIILDLAISEKADLLLKRVLVVVGVVLFIYGVYVTGMIAF